MANTTAKKGSKTAPRKANQRASRRPPRRSFYRRHRTEVWLVLVAAVGLAIFATTHRSSTSTVSSDPFAGSGLHSLVVDPTNPQRVYVGGHNAVAVSNDAGRTWIQRADLDNADAMGWAFTGDTTLVGGHPGLRVSSDNGRTFLARATGMPSNDIHALGAGPGVIYAASPAIGVLVSRDQGATWQVQDHIDGRSFMGRILVDPRNADHVLAPDMSSGAMQSLDAGRTWQSLGGVGGAMWVSWDPRDTAHILASGSGQAAVSTDAGKTWQPFAVPPGAEMVELNPSDPRVTYAASYDAITGRVAVRVSLDGGRSWARP